MEEVEELDCLGVEAFLRREWEPGRLPERRREWEEWPERLRSPRPV